MRKKWKLLIVLFVILAAGLYYYIALPAFNIHSTGTWFLIIVLWWPLLFFMGRADRSGQVRSGRIKGCVF